MAKKSSSFTLIFGKQVKIDIFVFFGKGSINLFVPLCTSAYSMEHNSTLISLNLEMNVCTTAHAQLSKMLPTKTQLKVPHEGNN